jgi:hypothetical protein
MRFHFGKSTSQGHPLWTKSVQLRFWKASWPVSAFGRLVGQSPPPIWQQTDHLVQVTKPPPSHTLNTNITLTELLEALKKLQKNKAADLDGMKAEFILDARELLHMALLTTFNCFLAKGFPKAFSTGVVHVLFEGAMPSNLTTTER